MTKSKDYEMFVVDGSRMWSSVVNDTNIYIAMDKAIKAVSIHTQIKEDDLGVCWFRKSTPERLMGGIKEVII